MHSRNRWQQHHRQHKTSKSFAELTIMNIGANMRDFKMEMHERQVQLEQEIVRLSDKMRSLAEQKQLQSELIRQIVDLRNTNQMLEQN